MTIGALDAENDRRFLETAFYDADVLDVLKDTDDRRSVVLGRTGAGKTALLLRLEQTEHRVIRIRPDSFSLNFLSNATILPYLTGLGVHLNLFYRWLWRHVIVSELIGFWAQHEPAQKRRRFAELILGAPARRSEDNRRSLINYRERWGGEFWIQSETVVKELVETLETNLKAELGAEYGGIRAGVGGDAMHSKTTTQEVINRAQKVVNETQIRELTDILQIAQREILGDSQKRYYIVIDDLDKEWVDEAHAYDLTDALLEEVGEFVRVTNLKVVVALRDNIFEQLHSLVGGRGKQREKREDLALRLNWSESELVRLVNLRLRQVLKGDYTEAVDLQDILPKPGKRKNMKTAQEFILERTFLRPRDLISFVNHCIASARDSGHIEWPTITAAELRYSGERLRSLEDEWKENYPGIGAIFRAFKSMVDGFVPENVGVDRLLQAISEFGESTLEGSLIRTLHEMIYEKEIPTSDVVRDFLVPILFRTGFLGVKLSGSHPVQYVFEDPSLLEGGLWDESILYFHPAVYRVLDIQSPHRGATTKAGAS